MLRILRECSGYLACLIALACGDGSAPSEPINPPNPPIREQLQLAVTAGNAQTSPVNCPLTHQLQVVARTLQGTPVPGIAVQFHPTDGIAHPAATITDANGAATTIWTLGANQGAQTLTISGTGVSASITATATATPIVPAGFGVAGNRIMNAECQTVRLLGVNRPGFQWRSDASYSAADFQRIRGWGANVVRINLSQGFWLRGSASYDANYAARVAQAVNWAKAAGLAVILDLHYSDGGNLEIPMAMGQRMPDINSITFWREVAERYKNDGRVIFDLYNEPHDVPWSVWRNGGPSGDGYTAVGMQELYDAVRATGAENLIIVTGLNWGYDLSGIQAHRLTGYNIVYATHVYDYPEKLQHDWHRAFVNIAARDPVFIAEFNTRDCSTRFVRDLLDVADSNGISWTAWAWFMEPHWTREDFCKFPSLIEDWAGTPTTTGDVIRERLQSYAGASAR